MLLAILKPLCLVWTVKRLTNTEQWITTCRRCIYKRIHKLIVNVMYSLCVQFSTHSSESSGDLWTEEEGVDHAGRDPVREGCPEEPWLKQRKLDEEVLKQQEILYTQVRRLPTWWLRRVGDQGEGRWIWICIVGVSFTWRPVTGEVWVIRMWVGD